MVSPFLLLRLLIAVKAARGSAPRYTTLISSSSTIVDDTVLAGTLVEFNGDAETIGQASVCCKLADTFALIYLAEFRFGHQSGVGHPKSGDGTRLAFDTGHVVDQERKR